MENYNIDLEKLTEEEANEILMMILSKFDVLAKCWKIKGLNQVCYLQTDEPYTENLKKGK